MKNKELQKEVNFFYLEKLQFDGDCDYYATIQDEEFIHRTVSFPRPGVIEIETNSKMAKFPHAPNNYLELSVANLEALIRLSKEYDAIID